MGSSQSCGLWFQIRVWRPVLRFQMWNCVCWPNAEKWRTMIFNMAFQCIVNRPTCCTNLANLGPYVLQHMKHFWWEGPFQLLGCHPTENKMCVIGKGAVANRKFGNICEFSWTACWLTPIEVPFTLLPFIYSIHNYTVLDILVVALLATEKRSGMRKENTE